VVRPTPGAGRLQNRSPAHPKAKERHPGHAPPKRARDAAAFAAISGTARNHLSCLYPSEEPLSAPGFSRMVERAAIAADLGVKAHAHMLRHACGRDPSLSWASQYSEYDAAYGLGTATVQGIFSGLNRPRIADKERHQRRLLLPSQMSPNGLGDRPCELVGQHRETSRQRGV
jgi:integrase